MQRGCFRIRTHDQQITKAQLYRCTRARPRITTFTIAVKKKKLLLLLSPLDLYKKMTREQSKSAGESVLKIQLEIGNLVTVGRSQAYQPCLMCVKIDWNYMKWFFNQYFHKVYIMPFKKQNLDFEVFCSCWKLCLSWAILSYRHQQGLVYVHRVYLVARYDRRTILSYFNQLIGAPTE